MTTNLRPITEGIAASLGGGWRFKPVQHDHYCYLVEAGEAGDGLTLWVRFDTDKPGRLIIRCNTPDALDIYGHRLTYSSGYVPRITVSATRTPASIAADIRSRLLPEAHPFYAKALAWKQECDRQHDFVENMRRQLAALPNATLGGDNRRVYGPGWECELYTDSAGLQFRRLTYDQAFALLRAYIETKEKPMPSPTQDHMFPNGDDLPLFSGAAPKVQERLFNPQPVAAQPGLLDLRPQFGGTEPQYQPTPEAQEAQKGA